MIIQQESRRIRVIKMLRVHSLLFFAASVMCVLATSNREDNISQTSEGETQWIPPRGRASVGWEPVVVDGVAMIQITVSGSSLGYVAMAISENRKMGPADDAYICMPPQPTKSSASGRIQILSALLVGSKPPVIVGEVDGTNVINALKRNDTMTCTFRRRISVTKAVPGGNATWDWSAQDYHVLYAEGRVSQNGDILMHNYSASTRRAYRMIDEFSDRPDHEELLLPQFQYENSVTALPNGGGRWTLSCVEGQPCRSVSWQPLSVNGNLMIKITLSGSNSGWLGVLVNKIPSMNIGGNCYVCFRSGDDRDQISVAAATCRLNSPPAFDIVLSDEVLETQVEDGIATCSFVRPAVEVKMVDGEEILYDMSNGLFIYLYSEGTLTPTGGIGNPTYLATTTDVHKFVDFSHLTEEIISN